MRFVFIALASLFLFGCAHDITLMARDGGGSGHGSAAAALGNSGSLTIHLNGDTYRGRWVFAPSGGGIGLLNTYGTNPSTGTMFMAGSGGTGNALLHGPGGKTLRCEFRYNKLSRTGVGVCQDGAGRLFDMQIA